MAKEEFGGFGENGEMVMEIGARNAELPAVHKSNAPRITPRETLDFQLVRASHAKLLEIATPLLGLCARVRSMESYESVEELHARVSNEIQNFSAELAASGYDNATIQAAQYCLCTMIDESVMSQSWGADSLWSETTMLSIFHNETWGGEKFFAILDRVINDSSRFPELLEFLYLCLILGFEGKYHIARNGQAKLDQIMKNVNQLLEERKGEVSIRSNDPMKNVVKNARSLKKQIPVSAILLAALAVIAAVYLFFAIGLRQEINEIGSNIDANFASTELQNEIGN